MGRRISSASERRREWSVGGDSDDEMEYDDRDQAADPAALQERAQRQRQRKARKGAQPVHAPHASDMMPQSKLGSYFVGSRGGRHLQVQAQQQRPPPPPQLTRLTATTTDDGRAKQKFRLNIDTSKPVDQAGRERERSRSRSRSPQHALQHPRRPPSNGSIRHAHAAAPPATASRLTPTHYPHCDVDGSDDEDGGAFAAPSSSNLTESPSLESTSSSSSVEEIHAPMPPRRSHPRKRGHAPPPPPPPIHGHAHHGHRPSHTSVEGEEESDSAASDDERSEDDRDDADGSQLDDGVNDLQEEYVAAANGASQVNGRYQLPLSLSDHSHLPPPPQWSDAAASSSAATATVDSYRPESIDDDFDDAMPPLERHTSIAHQQQPGEKRSYGVMQQQQPQPRFTQQPPPHIPILAAMPMPVPIQQWRPVESYEYEHEQQAKRPRSDQSAQAVWHQQPQQQHHQQQQYGHFALPNAQQAAPRPSFQQPHHPLNYTAASSSHREYDVPMPPLKQQGHAARIAGGQQSQLQQPSYSSRDSAYQRQGDSSEYKSVDHAQPPPRYQTSQPQLQQGAAGTFIPCAPGQYAASSDRFSGSTPGSGSVTSSSRPTSSSEWSDEYGRPRHGVHRKYTLLERLHTETNRQWADAAEQKWASDDAGFVQTVDESTRQRQSQGREKTMVDIRTRRTVTTLVSNKRVNSARYNYGFNHPKLSAITWKLRPPSMHGRAIRPYRHHGSGRNDEESDDETDSASAPTITQYVCMGPVTLLADALPACQSRADLSTAHRYTCHLVSHLHARIPLSDMARVLTFVETELSTVAPYCTMTYAVLFLERISLALSSYALPPSSQWFNHQPRSADAMRLARGLQPRQLTGNDEVDEQATWTLRRYRALQSAFEKRPHALLMVCIALATKLLDDIPKSLRVFLAVFPQITKAEYASLESAIVLLLDFRLWVTQEEYQNKREEIKQIM